MAIGAALLIGGPILACLGPDISSWLVSVEPPNESRDNIVFALPLFLLGLLLKLGIVLVFQLGGILAGLAGLILLIIALIRWLRTRGQSPNSSITEQ
jgi:hypothetical protein